MFKLSAVLVALSAAFEALALTTTFDITNVQMAPDGFSRSTVVAGGVFPGPLLTANKGDQMSITVNNQLTDATMLRSTSIHWHGFFQKTTNWADGPSFVNQCPISPGHSFLYQFSTGLQAGTFWYHSHLSTQYCDGLRGAIVVFDPLDPLQLLYDVDNAGTVIVLADWYHTPARNNPNKFPTADSILINGLGRYSGGPASDLAVVSVTKGKRYRMRLVSISCDPDFTFSIDGHTMTIIEADGIETDSLTVDSIDIFAGQRYSFVLNANQAVDNYWIRALSNNGPQGFAGGINSGILRYSGAPVAEPTSTTVPTSTKPMVETSLHPLIPGILPGLPGSGNVDKAINLVLQFDLTTLKFTVNGATFSPPTVPVLLQILSGTTNAADLLPSGSVIGLPGNANIELSLPGGVIGGGHPFHLHGHAFWVIRSAGSSSYNYLNPVQRDVVNIGTTGDNVTIRFRTDNPGPWFLHCHIDWHLEAGFAVVFAEDIPNIDNTENPPAAWSQLCPIYDALDSSQL